jgi:hypothetical protein
MVQPADYLCVKPAKEKRPNYYRGQNKKYKNHVLGACQFQFIHQP